MLILGWDNGSGCGEDAGRRGLYTPTLSCDCGALEEGLWERSYLHDHIHVEHWDDHIHMCRDLWERGREQSRNGCDRTE
jgi:hypothetical protein